MILAFRHPLEILVAQDARRFLTDLLEKRLRINSKIACAVAAILSSSGVAYAADAPTAAPDSEEASLGIQEVTVTAQRREESAQNVPITLQAITGEQLTQLNVATFDDVIRYLPNVSFATNGPGQGNIYMRGLSTGFAGGQSSASIAPFPNVASYLDDQSMQFPARNLDIYMADMERVEVLEGPQGTLFGGGAEAGAIRYITNKPKLNKTEGSAEASYGVTAGGDPNTAIQAMLNVPVIEGVFALRGVIYNDHRGGYIDNVPSTFTRQNSDLGNFYNPVVPNPVTGLCPNGLPGTAHCAPTNSQVGNNFALARNNENPVDYQGARLSGLYQFTDDWSLLVSQSYQTMDAEGDFDQYPIGSEGQILGPDQVTSFSPAFDKDKFENTAWTVDGKIWDLKAVYTGGYTVRNLTQQEDYTNYTRSGGGFYYSCSGGTSLGTGGPVTCYSPVTSWRDQVRNTHQSHEFRLSTPDDWRTRGIVGAYYEDFKIFDDMNFNYKTIPSCTPSNLATAEAGGAACVANVAPAPGSTATDPSVRGDSTAFGEDLQRGYKQEAMFASFDYDLIPKTLTITGGTRWYHYTEFETGSQYGTNDSCVNIPNNPGCTADTHNIDNAALRSSYHGFRSRGNLTWHVTQDAMVYYTFSQGFRPGGFNRTVSNVAPGPDIDPATGKNLPQFTKPKGYNPDELINNEVGWKTEFFDHRLQIDGSLYYMKWNNVQLLFFNPTELGNTTFGTNGPDYTIKGVELSFTARVTQGLTLMGSGSYNHSKQTSSPCLVGNIPGTAAYGNCITEVVQTGVGLVPFNNPFGSLGGTPAFSPNLEFNLRARYDITLGNYNAWAMFGGNHVGSMFNQTNTAEDGNAVVGPPNTTLLRYEQPGYTTYDASIGTARDNWTAEFFGTNLSNSNASVFTSSAQFLKSEVPLRPRVLGVKIGYKF
jgi:outer membrane receptor protein involved in Fe transport